MAEFVIKSTEHLVIRSQPLRELKSEPELVAPPVTNRRDWS
jgi:hypothetical protein